MVKRSSLNNKEVLMLHSFLGREKHLTKTFSGYDLANHSNIINTLLIHF